MGDLSVDVLDLFSPEKAVWSGEEIATHLAVSYARVAESLEPLLRKEMLENVGGGYRLGARLLDLARSARLTHGFTSVALPVMRALAEQTNETVLLGKRFGRSALCVEAVRSREAIRVPFDKGVVYPINTGAGTWVLMAWLPDAEVDEILDLTALEAFTSRTLTDRALIKDRLAEIRETGYATSHGEMDLSLVGVSAPMHGPNGKVRGAVTVAGTADTIPRGRINDLAEQLAAAAGQIGGRLDMVQA